MTESTNFGFTLLKGIAELGEILSISIPEIMTDEIEKTNHGSPNWREFIPNGLMEAGEFSATFIVASGTGSSVIGTVYTDMAAKTVTEYTITYPDNYQDPWVFNAFAKSIQVNEADAQSPELVTAEITFRPTGEVDITE